MRNLYKPKQNVKREYESGHPNGDGRTIQLILSKFVYGLETAWDSLKHGNETSSCRDAGNFVTRRESSASETLCGCTEEVTGYI